MSESKEGGHEAELIEALFVLARTVQSHGVKHSIVEMGAERVRGILTSCKPPFALQFVAEALFRDNHLVPVSPQVYKDVVGMTKALNNLRAQEIRFTEVPTTTTLCALGVALSIGLVNESDRLHEERLKGIEVLELKDVRMGQDSEKVSADVDALVQVALARRAIESFSREAPRWDWPMGLAILRRLERAIEKDPDAALKGLTQTLSRDDSIDIARRALLSCFHILRIMESIKAPRADQRAAGHAALALCMLGLESRGARPLKGAAEEALLKLMNFEQTHRSGIEPHKLRVCALLDALTSGEEKSMWLEPLTLVYALEKERCPPSVNFALDQVDVMALALERFGDGKLAPWVRILVSTMGILPPGAQVMTQDGKTYRVVGQGPELMRPRLNSEAGIFVPKAPVRLVSAVKRWAMS